VARWQGGEIWTPLNKSAKYKGDGAWCPKCRKRHGYMRMGIDYEKRDNGNWSILWSCTATGDVIEVQEIDREANRRRIQAAEEVNDDGAVPIPEE
jgi:hypothetical protein